MTEFEQVLQECLQDLEQGSSSVDECLMRHSQHAPQLEPILLTSAYLARGQDARLSEAFKQRVRTKLLRGMKSRRRRGMPFGFPFMRLAAGLAVMLLMLVAAGTGYAQRALPGDALYGWKLVSENAWRALSPDPVGTDLMLAERRAEELMAVRENSVLYSQTLNAYLEVVARLNAELDASNEARILAVLHSQVDELNRSGIVVPPLNSAVPPLLEQPTQIPASALTATPPLLLETPQAIPTNLPPIVPTIQAPEIRPTFPKLVPTIEIPPPIH